MKEIITKYFDYIGVTNEGYRRLLSLLLFTPIVLTISNIIFWIFYDLDEFLEFLLFQDSESIYFYIGIPIFILLPFIIIGVITKIINWVKEGFNK